MLHLIFQSPVETAILERIDADDAVVFMGHSVLRTLARGSLADKLPSMAESRRFYVLSDDIASRGIDREALIGGLEVIEYSGLVALAVDHRVIQSWY